MFAQMITSPSCFLVGHLGPWGIPSDGLLIAGSILIGVFIVVGLPIILGVRHSRRLRELDHLERMKALEMGHPLPGTHPQVPSGEGSPFSMAKMLGMVVPLGALGIAWLSTGDPGGMHGDISIVVWVSAGAVGMTGLICGTILAARTPVVVQAPQPTSPMMTGVKPPTHDPDAYDVVSRRG